MLIDRLAASLSAAKPYATIAELLARGTDATFSVPGLVRPALVAAIFAANPRPTLVVVAGEEVGERFWRQTAAFLGRERVLHLPDRSDLPWTDAAPDLEQVGARARALHALDKGRAQIVVASARALMRAVPPQGSRVFDPLVLAPGATLDLEEAVACLARMGYERVDLADEPGQFAVRGGILADVSPRPALLRPCAWSSSATRSRRCFATCRPIGQAIGTTEMVEVFAATPTITAAR